MRTRTTLTRRLAGFGLGLIFVALPVAVGAQGADLHRSYLTEHENGGIEQMANYGSVEMTELEEIAGAQNLSNQQIHFLESNLGPDEPVAVFMQVEGTELDAAHTAQCQGEGFVDSSNRSAVIASYGSIEAYCTPTAGFAAFPLDDFQGEGLVDPTNVQFSPPNFTQ